MKKVIFCICLCLAASGCVNPDDVRTLDGRVYEQSRRIDALDQKVEQATSQSSVQADSWSQMQSMRQELAEARGEIEMLRRDLDTLRQSSQSDMLAEDVQDMKIALQRMNSQLATDIDLAAIRAERQTAPAAAPADAAAATPAPGQEPATPGGIPMIVPVEPGQTGDPDLTRPAPAPAAPAATQSADTDAASTLYKSARAAFEAKDYKQGVALWEEFVTAFPKHDLVSNALFWQGESYFQLKDYARAVLKYQSVIDNYPKSSKYPTALLKQGVSFMRLDKAKMGRLRFEEVVQKFPQTAEGKRAAALLKEQN